MFGSLYERLMYEIKTLGNFFFRFLLRFFGELADIRKLFVWFDKNYSEDQIPSGTMTQRPLLLDPTNPYNNLLATGVEYTSDGVKPDLEFWT